MVSSYPSEYGLKHPNLQQRLTEREYHRICVPSENGPGLSFNTCNKEDHNSLGEVHCHFPALGIVAASLLNHCVGRLEATQTFPWESLNMHFSCMWSDFFFLFENCTLTFIRFPFSRSSLQFLLIPTPTDILRFLQYFEYNVKFKTFIPAKFSWSLPYQHF